MAAIMVYRCDSAFGDTFALPESIFAKVERYDLSLALKPLPPFIDLDMDEYLMIKDTLAMDRIKIEVKDYYGNPSFYSVMPQEIFNALEAASLDGEDFAFVDKVQFDTMISKHKTKMEKWEKSQE